MPLPKAPLKLGSILKNSEKTPKKSSKTKKNKNVIVKKTSNSSVKNEVTSSKVSRKNKKIITIILISFHNIWSIKKILQKYYKIKKATLKIYKL